MYTVMFDDWGCEGPFATLAEAVAAVNNTNAMTIDIARDRDVIASCNGVEWWFASREIREAILGR